MGTSSGVLARQYQDLQMFCNIKYNYKQNHKQTEWRGIALIGLTAEMDVQYSIILPCTEIHSMRASVRWKKWQKDVSCVPEDVKHLDFDDHKIKLYLFACIVIPSALYLSNTLENDHVFQQRRLPKIWCFKHTSDEEALWSSAMCGLHITVTQRRLRLAGHVLQLEVHWILKVAMTWILLEIKRWLWCSHQTPLQQRAEGSGCSQRSLQMIVV